MTDNLKTIIYETIGAASMCWEDLSKAGVFQSNDASKLGQILCDAIDEELGQKTETPSTVEDQEIFDELVKRGYRLCIKA